MRPYSNYSGDPRWITARFNSHCHKCDCTIRRGSQAFYYPKSKSVYCAGPCGQVAESDFLSYAQDEYAYNH